MSDPRAEFFERIGEQGFDPRLGHARGSVRFDVQGGDRDECWRVSLDRGAIQVTRDAEPADCVVRADAATLDRLMAGQINPTAALLRGLLGVQGELDLVLYFQRLLPGGQPEPAGTNEAR